MKLLVIGTDHTLFNAGSEARARIDSYAPLFDELHIVVASRDEFGAMRTNAGVSLYSARSFLHICWPIRAFFLAKRICRNRGISMVSAQDPGESGLIAWLIARKNHIPLHLQIHADYFSPYFRSHSRKDFLRWLIARFLIPRARRIRVVSERIKASIISRYPNLERDITVLPIFVPCHEIINASQREPVLVKDSHDSFTILMVCRLTREKNIKLALAAFQTLLHAFPASLLTIVGDGPEKARLKAYAKSLGVESKVRFSGYERDLIPYYRESDLYLLTSDYEGYARSVVEAAAAGLPVIMTNVGVAGDIIRNNETGRVVPVQDEIALEEALLEAVKNPTQSRAMADNAREVVLRREPSTMESYLQRYRSSFEV